MKNLRFPGLPRVLIVDDEEGVREGLRQMLQREGLHVETAGTAEDGVRRVEAHSFDIIFLDLNLPGDDGLSMLGRLRQTTPPADVVILTGYGTVANTVEEAGRAGPGRGPLTEERGRGSRAPVRGGIRDGRGVLRWRHPRASFRLARKGTYRGHR